MNDVQKKLKTNIMHSMVTLVTLMAIIGVLFGTRALAAEPTQHEDTVEPAMTLQKAGVMKYGLVAAAIAFGLGAVGAGIAISHVGAAAMGAVAEKPQIAGQALIFVALAEGIVVFGFITALMILGKV